MENKIKSFSLALLALSATSLFAADFEITSFGAKAGGLNTAAIQAAIDAAAKDGGRVVVPAGVPPPGRMNSSLTATTVE